MIEQFALYSAVVAAFVLGFSGSGHCVFMCGGLLSAFQLGSTNAKKAPARQGSIDNSIPLIEETELQESGFSGANSMAAAQTTYLSMTHQKVLYHIGRLAGYSAAGFLLALGLYWAKDLSFTFFTAAPRILASIVMIFAALYIVGWRQFTQKFDHLGAPIWRALKPILKYLIPIDKAYKALLVGLCWSLLPCGLIYSALTLAMASEAPWQAALVMLSFGTGTLPALIFSAELMRFLETAWFKGLTGFLLMVFGLWTLSSSLAMLGYTPLGFMWHDHHAM